jgi:[ribosomal protein S5]-alanine N-acetyltransferase
MSTKKELIYPSLATERVNLKILTVNDTEAVYKHFSDETITKYLDFPPCKDMEEAKEIISYHLEDSGCRWGLFRKDNNEFIGTCGFHYVRTSGNKIVAEVGFDLGRDYWGKGIMREVIQSVIEFGFSQIAFEMIDATVEPENERSIALMNRLGFERDSELKEGLVYFFLRQDSWKKQQFN